MADKKYPPLLPPLLEREVHEHLLSLSLSLMKALESSAFPTRTGAFAPTMYYEPTSVLDPHLTSSPAAGGGGGGGAQELHPLPWDLHHYQPPPASDTWDPLSAWLLSDKDDTDKAANFQYTDDPLPTFFVQDPSFPSPSESAVVDASDHRSPPPPATPQACFEMLVRAAHEVESGDLHTAHVILSRLNQESAVAGGGGTPLQRAAVHFRDALLALLPVSDPPTAEPPFSPLELVRRIAAHKAYSDLSPASQFTSFTANQTLLEALDAAPALHLIDFDLGLGGQWSSFAQEVAARSRAARRLPPPIRLTAIIAESSPESTLAADNLREFAASLGIRLSVDFVRIGGLGALALTGVRLSGGAAAGESAGVVLTPAVFRHLGSSPESDAALLRFIRRASPRVVVFVDTEPCGAHQPSFRRSYASGIEFYATVLEALDAAAAGKAAGEEAVRRVERAVIRPRVFASVAACGARSATWRETFMAAGMTPSPFSEFTESQAEWLLRRAPADGFHVARRDGTLVLSWRGRDLAATSAWRC